MSKKITHSIALLLLHLCTFNLIAQDVYKDIAPILIANCGSCHHKGGIKFSLMSYSDVVANSGAIQYDVQTKRMPPWTPDPSYKQLHKERIMSTADKNKLVNWIMAGMPAGDTTLAPPVPAYQKKQLNGTPDLIVKFPKLTSTANLNDHYYCINTSNVITQDRMIKAFEIIPSNPAIIHHAELYLDTTNTATDDLSGNCYSSTGQINLGGFVPDVGPTIFPSVAPNKFGMRMKANSTLNMQFHVPEGTAGEVDSTEVHFYFYPIGATGVRPMFFETVLQNWSFLVPANDSALSSATYPEDSSGVPINISLYAVLPHSHNTCKRITSFAYAGADTIPLIKIPKWDFHWQQNYIYPKMVKLPQGYNLYSEHLFDNTTNNPKTPDHNSPVYPGLFTTEEMHFDSYTYTYYKAGDENINISALLAQDPMLFPTSIDNTNNVTLFETSVHPNPMQQSTSIEFSLVTAQFVNISIYNQAGQEVKKVWSGMQSQGQHNKQWDGTNDNGVRLPSGVYIYKIAAGNRIKSGNIVLQ
jgi:FlgD Ig-like domain/Copper type II ascorbate-dependent monooxygenase, C-terminal domain